MLQSKAQYQRRRGAPPAACRCYSSMRFYTQQRLRYCRVDPHARSLYVCVLDHAGDVQVHQDPRAGPEAFLQLVAPHRADIAVARPRRLAGDRSALSPTLDWAGMRVPMDFLVAGRTSVTRDAWCRHCLAREP